MNFLTSGEFIVEQLDHYLTLPIIFKSHFFRFFMFLLFNLSPFSEFQIDEILFFLYFPPKLSFFL